MAGKQRRERASGGVGCGRTVVEVSERGGQCGYYRLGSWFLVMGYGVCVSLTV